MSVTVDLQEFGALVLNTGADITADAAGNDFSADGNTTVYIRFTNANMSTARVVTIDDPTSVGPTEAHEFDPDVVVSVPANSSRLMKLTPTTRFFNAGFGSRIFMTYDNHADLTFQLFV